MSSNNQNTLTNGSGKMSKSDASRIQSTQANGGNDTGAGSFTARAQRAGDKNTQGAPKKG
ncbi:hypothetical protein GQ43DRAFT_471405 [Delitschia confertaspora ATCC 74209]|uniref:SMP domain-containing protein n=1 Tax=Delitschia confertaspora ATCC 74209 TaxID=1513339 RepID=A0A9P4JM06_9PLEO|nr:hypothetical protein GQ43DRAFT_471405 [Delitschia confertaspora ATCC 74209]